MSHGSGDPKKAVIAAMAANGGIAIAKFVAAWFTESSTMLAEGVHSVADTANQGLLLLGLIMSRRGKDDVYPLGRAAESYFWSFIVALLLFFLGGVFAIYEGVHKLGPQDQSHVSSPLIAVAVLVVSILLEGTSFFVAFREFNKQRGDRTFRQALFDGKDPTLPVVLLEDTGAIIGLCLAMAAIITGWLTGNATFDAVGSIVIGVLLCGIGIVLARDTRSLLIGEGITPEVRDETVAIVSKVPGVEKISQLLSLHLGPSTVLLMMKVRFTKGSTLEDVERITNALEAAVREKLPMMKKIFVEPDSHYDPQKDPGTEDD